MSLRSRLVAGFLAVALALVGADFAVALLVRHSLVAAVDQRLVVPRTGPRLGGAESPGFPAGAAGTATTQPPPSVPRQPSISDLYIAVIDANGRVESRNANTVGKNVQPPDIPTDILKKATPTGQTVKAFSLSSEGGGYGFRAVALHTSQGRVLVIAESLKGTIETFNKVLLVEAIASLLVLLALATVAWWVLHLGVRPLDRMAQTADAIAEGDLSRRVDRAEPRTEVGRLGLALNKMLSEIEEAFDERRASEERLRRFIADASHELRTPLTSIRGYAELWRQGGLRSETELADAMRRTEQEAARMGVLVDDLLLLARLDQGRPLETGPVDLATLAHDAVSDARAVEPDRAISLDRPPHLVVQGDEGRLRQVMANMLANERDHTPPGTAVRVRLGADAERAYFEVEDDGPGLGPEPGRVFERFYRADEARVRAHGGTGLGLSIVASVVRAHGGRATAEATAGGGARVRVELPLLLEEQFA